MSNDIVASTIHLDKQARTRQLQEHKQQALQMQQDGYSVADICVEMHLSARTIRGYLAAAPGTNGAKEDMQ